MSAGFAAISDLMFNWLTHQRSRVANPQLIQGDSSADPVWFC
jgi:hypothetical protein